MKLPRRQFLHLAAGAAALPAMPRIAGAQAYPSRPITMIVGFPPGGPGDVLGRIISERMRASIGQPVVVENVGGANGSIGVGRAARAAPDGYSICLGHWTTHVVNGAIYPLRYDVFNDFEPVALIAANTYFVVARKTLPVTDLRGLVRWLKENADKASMGTQGVGGAGHVGGVFLQKLTDTRFQFVPYRGAAPDASTAGGPS
jgi:tripartite-type tricarboxylate transporter receptor subunit TctC